VDLLQLRWLDRGFLITTLLIRICMMLTCLCVVVLHCHAYRADQHWQQVVYRHALQCWQDKAVRGAVKWQSLAKALCFNKKQLLSKAIQGWQEAIQQQEEARAAAENAFLGVAQHLELQGAAAALRAWLEAAQLQAERRQLLLEVAAARQQRSRQQVRARCLDYSKIADNVGWLCPAASRYPHYRVMLRWYGAAAAIASYWLRSCSIGTS
jgi:hypothetical protein